MAAIGGTTTSAITNSISSPVIRGPLISLSRCVSSISARPHRALSAIPSRAIVSPSSGTRKPGSWLETHHAASTGDVESARSASTGQKFSFFRSVVDVAAACTSTWPFLSSSSSLKLRTSFVAPFTPTNGFHKTRIGRRIHSHTNAALAEGHVAHHPSSSKEDGDGGDVYMLTTPLYYVNAAPHMGSAYPTIAADALARFQRLKGKQVIFVTGTDEHGEKIATSAASNGREPKEHVDFIAQDYQSLWKELDISNDRFIRTTDPRHAEIVRQFFQRVWDQGDIYKADYEGLYCINCEEYKDEKELLEGSCCPIHRKPCEMRQENNYFFKLSKYQAALEKLYEENADFVRPSFRKNEVLTWINEGAKDFSISRAAVDWGIPVPADPKQTIYVWFDALVGYVTSLLEGSSDTTLEAAIQSGWPAQVHIIGKDILRFHAVYWPAMLMSAGLPLPKAIFGHGFLTKDGLKMGKSLGNTLEPKHLVGKYGADAVRYYFLKEIEFGKDGDFSEKRFVEIVNANLANNIGNLLSRTLGLLRKNCGGIIQAGSETVSEAHLVRAQAILSTVEVARAYEDLAFGAAGEAILALATVCNHYIDEKAPWAQFKKGPQEVSQAVTDLMIVLEASRIIAVLLQPLTPSLSRRMYRQLGFSDGDWQRLSWTDSAWGVLKGGHSVAAEPSPVFARMSDPDLEPEEPVKQRTFKESSKKKRTKNQKQAAAQDEQTATAAVAAAAGGQS